MHPRADTTARKVVVHGRVQGVFFRASTRDVALAHEVTGWVANRSDGAVEAWFEGRDEDVDAVVAWIRHGGPEQARVADIEVREHQPAGYAHFEIRA